MTDGPGSTPDVPSGWAAEQPPPYGAPWASPGSPGSADRPAQPSPPPGPSPHAPAPYAPGPQGSYGSHGPHGPYGPYGPYGQRPSDAPRPGIVPLRPLTLGDILDGTIKLIRSNPKATLGLSAVVAAIAAVPSAVGQALNLDTIAEVFADPYAVDSADATLGGMARSYIGTFLGYILTFVATTVLTGILTRVLGRAVFGGRVTAGEAWRLARSRVPALFGLVLLQGLILVLPALVLLLVVVGLVALQPGDVTPAAALGVFLLFFLAYIPYLLFFYTRLALAAPAIVLEGLGVTAAISRSWRLVRGDSWRVLGILLLTGFLVAILSFVLSIPFSIAGTLVGMTGGGTTAAAVVTAVLLGVGQVLASMIAYPFQAGVNGLLYADRRMRAEAFDLVLQTAAAQHQTQGWVHSGADDLWHPGYAAGPGPASGPYHGAPPYGPQG